MAGRIVYIDGSFPASGNVKLEMSESDKAAARIDGLRVALSPKGYSKSGGSIRNVANGKTGTVIGAPDDSASAAFNGKSVFWMTESDQLSSEAGSANQQSLTFVVCGAFSADDLAGTATLLIRADGSDDDTSGIRNQAARYLGAVSSPGLNINLTDNGQTGNLIIPGSYFEADVPFVVTVAYDAETRTATGFFNGEQAAQVTYARAAYTPNANDRWTFGFALAAGLSDSEIARFYIYDGNLLDSPYGEAQLAALTEALMSEFL